MSHTRSFPSVIDSTMLSALACHRRWRWSYEENYSPHEGKSIDLMAGAAFAKGAEIMRKCFLLGRASVIVADPRGGEPATFRFECEIGNAPEALECGIQALIYAYDSDTPDMGSVKTCDRMCGALEFYADRYPLGSPAHGEIPVINGKPGVEWNFAVPLPIAHPDTGEPLIFSGRTDMILDIFGGRYIEDDKTTKALGPTWSKQWDMRGQFVGYAWAARQSGLEIAGSIVRGISILKNGYDTQQMLVDQPDWKCEAWLQASVAKLKHAIELYRAGLEIPAFNDECNSYGGCEFKKFCLVKDCEGWIADNCTERNWNPLETH